MLLRNSPGPCCDLHNCDGVGQQDEERAQAEGSPGLGGCLGAAHTSSGGIPSPWGPLCPAAGSSRSTGRESPESKHQTYHTGQRLGRWGCSVGGVTGDLAPRPGFRSEIQRRRRREPCEYLRKESSGPRASGTHMALRQDRAQGAWRPLGRRFMPFKAVNREGSRSGRLCRAQGQQRRRRDLDGGWQGVGLGERQGAAVGVRTHPWEATSF